MDILQESLLPLRTRYNKLWQQTFLKWPNFWPKIAQTVQSKGETETYVVMDRIPQVRQWIGDRVIQNATLRSYQLKNFPYELTLGLDEYHIKDNAIDAYSPSVQMLASQFKKWPDVLLFNPTTGVMPNGASSSTALTYDGVAFFSTAHPINVDVASAGTQSNYASSGKGLNSANYGAVRQAMRALLGADLQPLGVNPKQMIVPAALEPTGIQVLGEEWIAPAVAVYAGASNTPQKNPFYGSADLLVVPDLDAASTTQWYLNDNTMPIKPFVFQLNEAAKFVMLTRPDDPNIFNKHLVLYGGRARGAAGYGPWFLSYRAQA